MSESFNGVHETSDVAVLTESKLIQPVKELVLPSGYQKPETQESEEPPHPLLVGRVFKHVKKDKNGNPILPTRPQGIVQRKAKEYPLLQRDEHGNPIPETDDKGNIVYETTENGTIRKRKGKPLPKFKVVLDDAGNPVIARRRSAHKQVNFGSDLTRATTAIKQREVSLAKAEAALEEANTPLKKEIAEEKLIIARVKRDYAVERFEKMLDYAKKHNLITLGKRKKLTSEEKHNPENVKKIERSLIVTSACQAIQHLDEVKDDYLLSAQVQAGGSRSHTAFAEINNKYKWVVNSHARPGKSTLELDDARSRGVEGLWDTARRYNPLHKGDKGFATFSTVADYWVFRNTRARTNADVKPGQFRVCGETKSFVSIDGQVNEDGDYQEFSLSSTESNELTDSVKFDLEEAFSALTTTQQTIIQLRAEKVSFDEISKIVKMPISAIRQVFNKTQALLQEKLTGYMP